MNKYLEKVAAKKKDDDRVLKAVGSHVAGGIAATPLALGSLASGLKMMKHINSPESSADLGTIKKFMRDNNLHKNVTFNTRAHSLKRENAGAMTRATVNHIDSATNPAYAHNIKGRGFIGGVKKRGFLGGKSHGTINKDVIMHELSHAKDFSRHGTIKHLGTMIARHPFSKAGFGAASIGALSSDGKARDYAPAIAAVPGAFMLREEGAANYHAYKGIKAHKGGKAANQFLKKVVSKNMANYGLAAAAPVAGAYVAKKIMDKWSPRKTEKK